ncbi:hypothetical protein O6H91_12G014600 [Diphasiastrum complanatum]|uniref:Uncharacterized protein n=1 Tax=Diphasiastrum complanatum TaxID=34168 RepID=A0ACC2BZ77_DIPCM|nr:hypothetical protein O6H91_12G014600 [Diphasiastrum complanatum]
MAGNTLRPVDEVLDGAVAYTPQVIEAPRLSGFAMKMLVWMTESRLFGRLFFSHVFRANKLIQILDETHIPDAPMYFPDYPAANEVEVAAWKQLDEQSDPPLRLIAALDCLPPRTPLTQEQRAKYPFRYWTMRDFAEAYRSGKTTPSEVAERFIEAVEDSEHRSPPMRYFVWFDAKHVKDQAAASTERFAQGTPLSILDGILIAVKDDIDCLPYPSRAGTTWLHKVREVKKDAVCVARLRQCGAILTGKTNMHELGMGTTGNNEHHGTTQNPHGVNRYTGGSSSGSAAIVASGLCSAAFGTDAGGSVRIPSALCGLVGLKATLGRTSSIGSVEVCWTMETIGVLASNVEDATLVYAAMLGSHQLDAFFLRPLPPALPLLGNEKFSHLGNLKLGRYAEALELFSDKYGTEVKEIVLPELKEMQTAHVVTVGSEAISFMRPYYEEWRTHLGYDARLTMAMFKNFPASFYIGAQRLRRRLMYYHMEAFKKVDVIVTPTTPLTAPVIPPDCHTNGETDLRTNGSLMRYALAGNILGLPCITVPVGYDAVGLPIGLQLIGRPWQEATLLLLASALEELFAASRKRPRVFYDVLCKPSLL